VRLQRPRRFGSPANGRATAAVNTNVSHVLPASRSPNGFLEKRDLPSCDLIFLAPFKLVGVEFLPVLWSSGRSVEKYRRIFLQVVTGKLLGRARAKSWDELAWDLAGKEVVRTAGV
jgi:hypothetical protein